MRHWRSKPLASTGPVILRTRCSGSTGSTISRQLARATACTTSGIAIAATWSTAAEIVEFLAMAEFRAGNWAQAEQALEDACDTLAQFELRGPFIASFADRSVIDAHRGRIERARRTLLGILGVERLDVFWRMVCHSAQGAVEFCAGDYEAADRAWTQMRAEARVVGWFDFLDDRSEPDHVEALLALGKLDEARRVLEHLEWRGRTLPRSWIDAGLPRARALVLAAEGKLAEALAIIDAAPATPCVAVRDGAPAPRQRPARTSRQSEAGGERLADRGARGLRGAGLAAVGAARAGRDRPAWPPSSSARLS